MDSPQTLFVHFELYLSIYLIYYIATYLEVLILKYLQLTIFVIYESCHCLCYLYFRLWPTMDILKSSNSYKDNYSLEGKMEKLYIVYLYAPLSCGTLLTPQSVLLVQGLRLLVQCCRACYHPARRRHTRYSSRSSTYLPY